MLFNVGGVNGNMTIKVDLAVIMQEELMAICQ